VQIRLNAQHRLTHPGRVAGSDQISLEPFEEQISRQILRASGHR
jgi:hypothetical protein